MVKKKTTKRLPSEINWLRKNSNNNITHIDFFNFFKTYDTRRVQIRFLAITDYVEDENLKKKLKDNYNVWRKTKAAKDFWKQRNLEINQLNDGNSPPRPQESDHASSSVTTASASATTTTTATVDSVETISFEDAKAIIAQDVKTEHSSNMYSNSLSRFKRDVYESMEAPLTYETHLQQLLAFSDIIYLEKNS
ncbi:uncharacterized protein EV154DRAFT_391437, partial [Mucor mucedo]|uniref:uncharacterized protein n=1 Tax=Mucor mucedo TaxID=29922 RepID=UPI00221F1E21